VDIDFKKLMSEMSDAELDVYINNIWKYTAEAVYAAIEELEHRGRVFSDLQRSTIEHELERKAQEKEQEPEIKWEYYDSLSKDIVTDESAPLYYSKVAIYWFTVLVNPAFGAILLAINLRSTESKNRIPEVVSFGIITTAVQLWLIPDFSFGFGSADFAVGFGVGVDTGLKADGFTFNFVNILCAYLLPKIYWARFIGNDTPYRTKSLLTPWLVAIVVIAIQVYLRYSIWWRFL